MNVATLERRVAVVEELSIIHMVRAMTPGDGREILLYFARARERARDAGSSEWREFFSKAEHARINAMLEFATRLAAELESEDVTTRTAAEELLAARLGNSPRYGAPSARASGRR